MNAAAPTRQIILAYTLLLCVVASLWITVLQPAWEGYTGRRTEIEAQQSRLERLEQAVAVDPALDPEASGRMTEALRQYIVESSLSSRTADIGGSILRQRLLTSVLEHGGKPGDTRISNGADPSMISISMNLTIGLPGLRDVLYELERARPFVFVDVLSIRYPGRIEAAGSGDSAKLAVQINVSSFWTQSPVDGGGS